MREAHLAGTRLRAAADDRARGSGVMRRAKRPSRVVGRREPARAHRCDGGDVERFVAGERRQQSGQPLRQHALAGAGGTDEQQAVSASGRDHERTLRGGLSAHVREVELTGARREVRRASFVHELRANARARELAHA
jgi:hypothetical protein